MLRIYCTLLIQSRSFIFLRRSVCTTTRQSFVIKIMRTYSVIRKNGYPFQLEYKHINARLKQRNKCFSRRRCFGLSAAAAAGSSGDICDCDVGGGGDGSSNVGFVRHLS